jgi:hypothetical protein
VDAIIFLAPISGFDQVLVEDNKINRLVRLHSLSILYELSLLVVTGRLHRSLEGCLFKQAAGECRPGTLSEQV